MTYREWLTNQNTGEWNIQPRRAYNAGYNLAVKYMTTLIEPLKAASYAKGIQAERERIRARAQIAAEKTWKAGDWYIGPQHNMIERFVDALLEESDEHT